MSVDSGDRVGSRAAWIPSLVILALGAWTCLGPEVRLGFVVADDAYYYFNVARNLAAGAGSTFDGLNASNGYHPLWCGLLVPVFLATDDPGVALRLIGAAWFLLAAALPRAVYSLFLPRTGARGALVAAACCLHPWIGLVLSRPNGLETPLLGLAVVAFAGAWERTLGKGVAPSTGRLLGLGALLGLAILARTDAGILAVAAAVLAVTAAGPRAAAVLALGATLVAGPSLAWNQVAFGSPVPISGRVVAAWDAVLHDGTPEASVASRAVDIPLLLAWQGTLGTPVAAAFERGGAAVGLAVIAATAAAAALALRRRRREGPLAGDALALLVLFAAAHFLVYAFLFWTSGERVFRIYYFLPQCLAVAGVVGTLLGGPRVSRRVGTTLAALALAASVAYLAVSVRVYFAREDLLEPEPPKIADWPIFRWIRSNTPDDAVLGAFAAGRLGYFSGRTVVNLDGLINGTDLLRAIREDRIERYVADSPIGYLVAYREALHGFDASLPAVPPALRRDVGELAWRLANREGLRVLEIPDAPEGWVVLELRRPPWTRRSPSRTVSAVRERRGGGWLEFARESGSRPAPSPSGSPRSRGRGRPNGCGCSSRRSTIPIRSSARRRSVASTTRTCSSASPCATRTAASGSAR